jgi:DNA-binding NarL/FixJ family response regulator
MRVLIADDHDLVRDVLASYLQLHGNITTTTACDLAEACALIESEERFDLILLDLSMPGMQGLDGLRHALALNGGQRVALISGTATREIARNALEEGAAGFVPKTLSAKSMINAVKFMAMGEIFIPLDFLNTPDADALHPLLDLLTPKEAQTLKELTEGKSNKEIARDMGVSEPTVKLHLKSVFRKFGASNRVQAVMIAHEAKLF